MTSQEVAALDERRERAETPSHKKNVKKAFDAQNADSITDFMNKSGFSLDEIKQYPYDLRKTYVLDSPEFNYEDGEEPMTFYATDDDAAIRYIKRKYVFKETYDLSEQITTFRQVCSSDSTKEELPQALRAEIATWPDDSQAIAQKPTLRVRR